MAFKDLLKSAASAAYNTACTAATKYQEDLSKYSARYSSMNRDQLKREFELYRSDILCHAARRIAFSNACEREGIHLVHK